MYQKSAQKLSTDKCYPETAMEELKEFRASLDDLIPFFKLILALANSFSGDTEKLFP